MINITYIFSGDLWAGAEVVVYNLIKELRNYCDTKIIVILFNEGKFAQKIRELDIETYILDENKNNFFILYLKAFSLLRNKKIDFIHSHRYKENILAFLLSLRLRNLDLISTVHGLPEIHPQKKIFKYWLLKRMNYIIIKKFFKIVVCVSNDIKKELISKLGFPLSKVRVIHNGIDISVDEKQIKSTGVITIGSAGRLVPVKDYGLMIDIAAHICIKRKDVKFMLIGDGPQKAFLFKKIKDYGLDNSFELIGFTEKINEFYSTIDVYLNTSFHEGIPMSILEAMANELPVVAPLIGGLPEIIDDGIDGFLIDSRNPEDYVKKCMILINDKHMRKNLAKNARIKVLENFSLKNMTERYRKLYLYKKVFNF